LQSERLPGKALLPICGRPILWHLLDRVGASRYLAKKDVVVCTTTDAEDTPLVEAVERYGASVFRGSRDDIIERFHGAMSEYGFDAVVQVDGDDPLCATEYMDLTMARLLSGDALDIVTASGLPLGIASKSFTRAAMEKVYRHYRSTQNDTGFIYFFTKTGLCRQAVVEPLGPEHVLDAARLTLDYPVDLELFTRIFEALYVEGEVFDLATALDLLRRNPDWLAINNTRDLDAEYWRRTAEKAQLFYRDEEGVTQKI
jgi:spore coat polysaccharide biosynthesis protein SpsF